MFKFSRIMSAQLLLVLTIFAQAGAASAEEKIYTGFFSSTAVSGYDTVAYFTEGKPVKGTKNYKTQYMGATWLFSSEENLQRFKANPKQYAPQYGGYCAWAIAQGHTASADPKQWSIENGKLYLNYDASVKAQWLDDKDNFIKAADLNWPRIVE